MYVGIDFGTCFSQVATMHLNQPKLLLNPGEYGIPSAFYYDELCGIMIGEDALGVGQGFSAVNLVREVKMDLKRQEYILDGKSFTPKEIIQYIYGSLLRKGRNIASKNGIPDQVEGVVISVPVKFSLTERNVLFDAARTCLGSENIPITGIIKEPVAAALTYYQSPLADDTCVLVFDLGGGTCDVALVCADSTKKERFEVVDSDMLRIGGRDWDDALIRHLVAIVEQRTGIAVSGNEGYMEKIRRAAVTVKHQLSDSEKRQAIAMIELGGRMIPVPVARTVFDEITSHLLKQAMDCLEELYDKNRLTHKIHDVICVGGSSNMLQVKDGIQSRFPDMTVRVFQPELAVAHGTAIYAEMLGPNANLDVVEDKASFSYGVRCLDNNELVIVNIVRAGDPLPSSGIHMFNPTSEGQSNAHLNIYETEPRCSKIDFNTPKKRKVGTAKLTLSEGATSKTLIRCTMKLNQMGLLEISAVDDKGARVEAQFQLDKV